MYNVKTERIMKKTYKSPATAVVAIKQHLMQSASMTMGKSNSTISNNDDVLSRGSVDLWFDEEEE